MLFGEGLDVIDLSDAVGVEPLGVDQALLGQTGVKNGDRDGDLFGRHLFFVTDGDLGHVSACGDTV